MLHFFIIFLSKLRGYSTSTIPILVDMWNFVQVHHESVIYITLFACRKAL